MNKILPLFILLFISLDHLNAQDIKKDIFDNLELYSPSINYRSYLKKDIFESLIFSDNNGNRITYDAKYINSQIDPHLYEEENKRRFLKRLSKQFQTEHGYVATYKVDIFDKVLFSDNRNNSSEMGTDIFGNQTYKETIDGQKYSLKTEINGETVYSSDNMRASVKKDIFDKWTYTDSQGNNVTFNIVSFNRLKNMYGNDGEVLLHLVKIFISDK